MKPHALFALLLIASSAIAISVTGSSSASRTDRGATLSSSVDGTTLDGRTTLSGQVTWTASPTGTPNRVEFLIDGRSKWTDQAAPYQFGGDPGGRFDTTSLSDGQHTLKVKAYPDSGGGHATTLEARVTIRNGKNPPPPLPPPPPPPSFAVASSIVNGATLAGALTWTAVPSGATVTAVDFVVDGTVQWTERISPYVFDGDGSQLDTQTLGNGAHTLAVQAHAADGRTATATSSVTVANGALAPPTSLSVTSSIADGSTLSGSLVWKAATTGDTVGKVEFSVDGTLAWTDQVAPYRFGGDTDGRLDTTTLDDGPHTFAVRAYGTSGLTAAASASVTVSNASSPAAPTPPAPSFASVPRFGIATGYKILTRSAADQAFELDQIKAVGAKLVRFDSLPGNQSQVDPVVNGVLSRGMEPILVLFGTTGPISPSTAASFAANQAAKWKGRVRLYEFTNEPDLNGWNGTNYAKALIAAYDAIKQADPGAIVIAGALWKGAGGPVQWLTDMYNAGAKGHFDILFLHLYDDPLAAGSWNIWNTAFHTSPSVRSVLDAHGDQNIPIAATEAGGPVTTYGEAGQASIINDDFDALTNDPRLAFICVYSMMDDDVPGFGLLNPNRTKRQAWTAYQQRATS